MTTVDLNTFDFDLLCRRVALNFLGLDTARVASTACQLGITCEDWRDDCKTCGRPVASEADWDRLSSHTCESDPCPHGAGLCWGSNCEPADSDTIRASREPTDMLRVVCRQPMTPRLTEYADLLTREFRSRGNRQRWVDQDRFGGDHGNCFAACVASILCWPLDAVPNFCAEPRWFSRLRDWLEPHSLTPVAWDISCTLDDARVRLAEHLPETLVIVSGPAERGHKHATVWWGGEMVHDPHPSRAGLLSVDDVILLVAREPRAYSRGGDR